MDEYMLLAIMHHWTDVQRPLAACPGFCPLAANNFFILADQLQGPGARLKTVLSTKGVSPDGMRQCTSTLLIELRIKALNLGEKLAHQMRSAYLVMLFWPLQCDMGSGRSLEAVLFSHCTA